MDAVLSVVVFAVVLNGPQDFLLPGEEGQQRDHHFEESVGLSLEHQGTQSHRQERPMSLSAGCYVVGCSTAGCRLVAAGHCPLSCCCERGNHVVPSDPGID